MSNPDRDYHKALSTYAQHTRRSQLDGEWRATFTTSTLNYAYLACGYPLPSRTEVNARLEAMASYQTERMEAFATSRAMIAEALADPTTLLPQADLNFLSRPQPVIVAEFARMLARHAA